MITLYGNSYNVSAIVDGLDYIEDTSPNPEHRTAARLGAELLRFFAIAYSRMPEELRAAQEKISL